MDIKYKQLIQLENDGLHVMINDNFMYILHGKFIGKYNYSTMNNIAIEKIFSKEGKARSLHYNNNKIYIQDFCDLYEIDPTSLKTIYKWKLGMDASSDICRLCFDDRNIYVSIRGGIIKVIHNQNREVIHYNISDSSSWAISDSGQFLYVGTVNGEVLKIKKSNMEILINKSIHKKNVYSIIIDNNLLYTISLDGALKMLSVENFEVKKEVKQNISNMSTIIGIYLDYIISSNPRRRELSIWAKSDLSFVKNIQTGGLSNKNIIINNNLIILNNSKGIYSIDIDTYIS